VQRLNHHHLYIFWVFARSESVTKTAQELAIAPSAVTSQLKQLEESLQLSLIDRTQPRYPRITEEGRKLLDYADSIFETTRELINWATRGGLERSRVIRIGALSGLSRNLQYEFIAPLLAQPRIKFEVTTGDQTTLVQLLKEHQLDVILSSHNVSAEKGAPFYSHVLTQSPLVFVMKKDKKKIDFKQSLKERALCIPGTHFEAKAELDAYLDRHELQGMVSAEVDDIALLRIMALRSGQVVALPEMGVKTDIAQGDLVVLRRLDQIVQRFYAITRSKLRLDREVQQLIESLRN
jgi:LysR family transcriptional activator of nhaA